jgi:hypothetical protein
MKKLLFALLLVSLTTVFSCTKNNLEADFTVTDTENFTIPPNSILTLPSILTPAFPTSTWQGDFTNNNTDKNHIKELKLKTLTLSITNPPNKTFGFIKNIEIYIQAKNLPDTKIAYIENNSPNSGSVLNMNVVDVDISAYAKADSFTLRVESTPQQTNTDNVDVKADMSFAVKANVL